MLLYTHKEQHAVPGCKSHHQALTVCVSNVKKGNILTLKQKKNFFDGSRKPDWILRMLQE